MKCKGDSHPIISCFSLLVQRNLRIFETINKENECFLVILQKYDNNFLCSIAVSPYAG